MRQLRSALAATAVAWVVRLPAVPSVLAANHTIFTANRNAPAQVHMLAFDDAALRLSLVRSLPGDTTHTWLSLSQDKTYFLASSLSVPRTSVYAVNKTSISLASSVAVASQPSTSSNASSVPCTGKTAVFTQSSPLHLAPNLIFSASYPADASSAGCGAVLQANASTSGRQTAAPALATWRYAAGSGIHGMAAHAGAGTGSSSGSGQAVAEVTLYSADLGTDSLWTHRFVRPSSTAGVDVQVTELGHTRMETTTADGRTMHPRHLAVHPNGRVLYAIMEADNSLVAFDLDAQGVPVVPAGGIKDIWDLLPDGVTPSQFWSADLSISRTGRYIWATARARQQRQPQTGSAPAVGYMSVFELAPDGSGRILRRLPGTPVATSTKDGRGTMSNAVAAAPWGNDDFAVLSDVPGGYVEVWRLVMDGGAGADASLKPVARVDIGGGCCANAIWFD